jgi:hypothetical protein
VGSSVQVAQVIFRFRVLHEEVRVVELARQRQAEVLNEHELLGCNPRSQIILLTHGDQLICLRYRRASRMDFEVLHTSEHSPQLRFSHRREVSEEKHERTSSILRSNETRAFDRRARGARRKQKKDGEQVLVHPFF